MCTQIWWIAASNWNENFTPLLNVVVLNEIPLNFTETNAILIWEKKNTCALNAYYLRYATKSQFHECKNHLFSSCVNSVVCSLSLSACVCEFVHRELLKFLRVKTKCCNAYKISNNIPHLNLCAFLVQLILDCCCCCCSCVAMFTW